ncbi:MAG: hypothetical protein ABR981_03400 [Candidatus Micrarchaeaceae archaeon]|jgi:hypothetical protein
MVTKTGDSTKKNVIRSCEELCTKIMGNDTLSIKLSISLQNFAEKTPEREMRFITYTWYMLQKVDGQGANIVPASLSASNAIVNNTVLNIVNILAELEKYRPDLASDILEQLNHYSGSSSPERGHYVDGKITSEAAQRERVRLFQLSEFVASYCPEILDLYKDAAYLQKDIVINAIALVGKSKIGEYREVNRDSIKRGHVLLDFFSIPEIAKAMKEIERNTLGDVSTIVYEVSNLIERTGSDALAKNIIGLYALDTPTFISFCRIINFIEKARRE